MKTDPEKPLLTEELKRRIPGIGSTASHSLASMTVYARFQLPCRDWEWYILEFDGADKLVGIAVNGPHALAGQFTLTELQAIAFEDEGGKRTGVRLDPQFLPRSVASLARERPPIRALLVKSDRDLVTLHIDEEP